MLSNAEKIQRLQDCIALLHDVNAMQQAALGATDVCYENHNTIENLIDDFEADIESLSAEDADDGQPDEMQEWHDFDPDC